MLPLKVYFNRPSLFFSSLLWRLGFLFSDKVYLQMMYYLKTGERLDFRNPRSFNEKMQWLKLYNRRQEYTTMVDKYAVKLYVRDIVGEKYMIPSLGAWDRPEDIDFESLPEQFVLKTTHGGGSGGVVICRDRNKFDRNSVIRKLKTAMKQDIYRTFKEWPYKNVRRRIIAEEYLSAEDGDLKDYKIHCFGGVPRIIEVDFNRFVNHQRILYDTDWNRIEATISYPNDGKYTFPKPQELDELLWVSEKLSQGIPYVRTDLYIVNHHVYFGELTFFHDAGYGDFNPKSYGYEMGDWITLPEIETNLDDNSL